MLSSAFIFLADAVIGFFTTLFLLRFFMQAFRVSFAGAYGHFVVTLTNWGALPLRRIVPGLFGLDLASLLCAFLLQLAFMVLVAGLSGAVFIMAGPSAALLIVLGALRGLLRLSLYLLIGVVILQAILSWIHPHSPAAGPLNQITRPLLAPIQRVLPPISGVDLSPWVAVLIAQLVLFLIG